MNIKLIDLHLKYIVNRKILYFILISLVITIIVFTLNTDFTVNDGYQKMNSTYMYENYIKESMSYYYLIVSLFAIFLPSVTLISDDSSYDQYLLTSDNKTRIIFTKLCASIIIIIYYAVIMLILLWIIPYLLVDYMRIELNVIKYVAITIIYASFYNLLVSILLVKFDSIFGLFILLIAFLIMKINVDEIVYLEKTPMYTRILQVFMPILSIDDRDKFTPFITVQVWVSMLLIVLLLIEVTSMYRKNRFS